MNEAERYATESGILGGGGYRITRDEYGAIIGIEIWFDADTDDDTRPINYVALKRDDDDG